MIKDIPGGDRDYGRKIRNEISGIDVETQYSTRKGIVYLRVPEGIKDEQRFLVRMGKRDLLEYLTIPPSQGGDCRNGHPIVWTISPYGVWICGCYFVERAIKFALTAPEKFPTLTLYWMEGKG